ncbi:transcriptional regulator [Candidatus Bathyarchaeota archaeon]|nr:transcriptional regulator [Candidatus Bathyarchaeota archaeon]MBL7168299.1 transcriptional regulator [Candidatus Bathyarchaeota archaeon]
MWRSVVDSRSDDLPSVGDIDKLIHEPARLLLIANLYVVESADFLFLMRQTGMTFGNLSSHMSKLEAAGYIDVEKEFVGKKPNTKLNLTENGRRAFEVYRKSMQQLFTDVPSGSPTGSSGEDGNGFWSW